MTDERVERAFREHPDFERTDDRFETVEKPFPGTVSVIEGDADADDGTDADDATATDDATDRYRVEVRTPTLDAAVEGETVAAVVDDGWFETLELRLENVHTVTNADLADPPTIEREDDEVVVTVEFERADADYAAEDALAVVEYVEGTWVQGIVPGYDYREPAAGLRESARRNYDEGERRASEGNTSEDGERDRDAGDRDDDDGPDGRSRGSGGAGGTPL